MNSKMSNDGKINARNHRNFQTFERHSIWRDNMFKKRYTVHAFCLFLATISLRSASKDETL